MSEPEPPPEGQPRRAENETLPGGDFRLFIQKLGYQALISMGIFENPLTGARTSNLPQAQGLIDDLLMLRDKTRGNLDEEEDGHLTDIIDNLQKHYVELSKR